MSFVSAVVCNQYILVVADCRSSMIDNSGNYIKTVSDNVNKIHIITENCFMQLRGVLMMLCYL